MTCGIGWISRARTRALSTAEGQSPGRTRQSLRAEQLVLGRCEPGRIVDLGDDELDSPMSQGWHEDRGYLIEQVAGWHAPLGSHRNSDGSSLTAMPVTRRPGRYDVASPNRPPTRSDTPGHARTALATASTSIPSTIAVSGSSARSAVVMTRAWAFPPRPGWADVHRRPATLTSTTSRPVIRSIRLLDISLNAPSEIYDAGPVLDRRCPGRSQPESRQPRRLRPATRWDQSYLESALESRQRPGSAGAHRMDPSNLATCHASDLLHDALCHADLALMRA